jgi:hypothetical protein
MVLGACCRVLGNEQAAENTFQTTFLVLREGKHAADSLWQEF